ncbi:hypothetical protein JAG49_003897 [Morganella morganii]|nr:hypothetical protein [Morganella morganii]
MNLMSISQYARHAGMSRQALYNWEAKQGFPARVDGKINQAACDQYLARYRDSHDPRIKNNTPSVKAATPADGVPVPLSVAEIRQLIAAGADRVAGMDGHERATLAAKAVGLYLSEGPDNPPVTFGGYRLAIVKTPEWETGQIVAGGAFGLSADDVIFECRDYTLALMDDETEDTALRDVVPSLLYVLADDNKSGE